MAYTTINKSTDYFTTSIYDGAGSAQSVVTGTFQPDLIWIKARDKVVSYLLTDSVRGIGKQLYPATNGAETSYSGSLTSFNSDGFSIAGGGNETGHDDHTYVSWNWKANGSGSSNTDGNVNTTVSANATAGFSIVKYTGSGSQTATFGHGLNAVPKMIIIKKLNAANDWVVYHEAITSANRLKLNTSEASSSSPNWRATPTSSVFNSNASDIINNTGDSYIAYCFAEKPGYSKIGSYTGNGSADGPFTYTGFKPSWILLKNCTQTDGQHWELFDNKRLGYNGANNSLQPNVTNVESLLAVDILSNGFKLKTGHSHINTSGSTYIYMAFGQSIVGSNNVPVTAR